MFVNERNKKRGIFGCKRKLMEEVYMSNKSRLK
jgi:hypothetical protein